MYLAICPTTNAKKKSTPLMELCIYKNRKISHERSQETYYGAKNM